MNLLYQKVYIIISGFVLIQIFLPKLVRATIDINLPEFEYLADHLTVHECRQLVTALHDKNYDIVTNLDTAERKVPQDETCLKLLLHWNSTPGEGRGQDQEMLCHRLHQIGRKDLAEWLSKAVFHQLGEDLKKNLLSDPFRETATRNNYMMAVASVTMEPSIEPEEPDQWMPMDSILCVFAIVILTFIILMLARICRTNFHKNQIKSITEGKIRLRRKSTKNRNVEVPTRCDNRTGPVVLARTETTNSEEVSEDDPTLSLLGISKPSEVL